MASNSFKVKNSLVLTPKDLSTLTSPEAGDLACDINDSNKIKRYDANSAAWVEVGSGGVGGVDIFFVQDFESASLSSFTQTGLVLSQTDPLKGKVSAVLTHQAGTSPTNDQKFKQVIPVDRKFRGQTMVLRLDAKSNASAGNLVINIYDETNSANIVASEQLEISNDVNGAKSSVSFTIPESCASLSYTITALPQSGSPVSRIDDIICELASTALLETAVEVPVVTSWQGYTPTFQGFGTPTNVEFEWRQVGENVEIRGKFTTGTTTAVEARVGLPAGLTSAGTSLIPSIQSSGTWFRNSAGGATSNHGGSILLEPSVSYLTFSPNTVFSNTSSNYLSKGIASTDVAAVSDILSIVASVPCAGLSATTTKTIPLTQSGLVQEADSRIYAAGNGGQAITVNVTDIPFTAISSEGNDISFNGSSVTALSNGIYSFDIGILFTTSLARRVSIYVNNAVIYETASATDTSLTSNITLKLNSGDIVKFRVSGNGGTLNNASQFHYLSVTKQGSLKQVSVNPNSKITIPTSELRMEGASTRGSTATAIVRFDNVTKLRGDAFTVESDAVLGTRITMKKAGKLNVSSTLFINGTNSSMVISRNQAVLTALATASESIAVQGNPTTGSGANFNASAEVFVAQGDVIRVSIDPTVTLANVRASLNLSFQEQEIAVSVSNVLPQFSESDLVVRAAGNAGQSITANVTNIPFQTSFDSTGGAWNGSQFTVSESGIYSLSGTVFFSTVLARALNLYVDGALYRRISMPLSNDVQKFDIVDSFSAGQVLSIRSTDAGTLTNNTNFHYLNITKVGKPNVTGVDVTPFVNVPQPDVEYFNRAGAGFGSTNTEIVTFNLTTYSNTLGSRGILAYSNSSTLGDSFTALKRCSVSISLACTTITLSNATYDARILKNDITGASANTLDGAFGSVLTGGGPETETARLSGTFELQPGDVIRFRLNAGTGIWNASGTCWANISATALSDQILTAPETFSTDTASLRYANASEYTLSTLANAPVGTYITFTYAANTNTRTQTTTRPTQTDADMNANGIRLFSRAYNAASTSGNPSAIAVQIGKGLKGVSLNLYKSAGKVTSGELDRVAYSTTHETGCNVKSYNEATGILIVDIGGDKLSTNTSSSILYSDLTAQTSGYLVINASKNPALTGLGLNRVAAKASSTSGQVIGTVGNVITYDATKIFDTNGALNAATGVFTAPESGYYSVSGCVTFASRAYAAGNAIIINFRKNGVAFTQAFTRLPAFTNVANVTSTELVYLAKNDTLDMYAINEAGNTATVGYTTISIAKISV